MPFIFDEIKDIAITFLLSYFLNIPFDISLGLRGNIVLCVSPLTAIMHEQTAKFSVLGINAEFVGEEQTDPTARHHVIDGQVQLVFISPENLMCNLQYRGMLRAPCYKSNLVAVAVDEAHCVKLWYVINQIY